MDCDYSVLLFFLHNFTTIMCAAVVRYVLVKSDKREYCGWNALADVKKDISLGLNCANDGHRFSDSEDDDLCNKGGELDLEKQSLSQNNPKESNRSSSSGRAENGRQVTQDHGGDEQNLHTEQNLITDQDDSP